MRRDCLICKTEFSFKPYRKNTAKFCSFKCYWESMRGKINKETNTFIFITSKIPEKVGIDPLGLLVDRVPEDNLKNVKL